MKREYAAYECLNFSKDINNMSNIANDRRLRKNEKDKQLEDIAKNIISKGTTPPVSAFYLLKNQNGGAENKLRDTWIKAEDQSHYCDILEKLKLNEPEVNIEQLPQTSWLLTVDFTLNSPYISQDDNPFYILNNPLRREWVFKVPYIAPSQWKGMLRASLTKHLVDDVEQIEPEEFAKRRFLLTVLFGDEKGEDEENGSNLVTFLNKVCEKGRKSFEDMLQVRFNKKSDEELPSSKGNLFFYTTYFNSNKTNFEIINPHDRTSGSGRDPFHLEIVPAETNVKLTILYIPLYAMPSGNAVQNAIESLELVTLGFNDLFMYYGIGAKTSSGFGTVKNKEIKGYLNYHKTGRTQEISAQESAETNIPREFQPLLDENGEVKAKFLKNDGNFYSNKEFKPVSGETGISLRVYKRFRAWSNDRKATEKISTDQRYCFGTLKEMLELPLQMTQREGEEI